MAILRLTDYYQKKERPKKVKLPTEYKSKKCTYCDKLAVKVVHFSGDKRTLCQEHLDKLINKDKKYDVTFKKASEI